MSQMTRKQILLVVVFVLVASALSALVGYYRGMRRSAGIGPSAGATPVGAVETCFDIAEAASLVGKQGCVRGRVLRVFTSRAGNTFLDFCPDYRSCPFASVVFSEDRSKFGELNSLRGRQVELRGEVTSYQGRAEIIIHDPEQIRAVP
jgi:hypothetical protein